MSSGCRLGGAAQDEALHRPGYQGVEGGEYPQVLPLVGDLRQGRAVGVHQDEAVHAPGGGDEVRQPGPEGTHCVAGPGQATQEEEQDAGGYPDDEDAFSLRAEGLHYEAQADGGYYHRQDEGEYLKDVTLHREVEDAGHVVQQPNHGQSKQRQIRTALGQHVDHCGAAAVDGIVAYQARVFMFAAAKHSDSQDDALLQDEDNYARHDEGVETALEVTKRHAVNRHRIGVG